MSENNNWCCSGGMCCGGKKSAATDMDRRQFIIASAAAAGGAGLLLSARGATAEAVDEPAWEAWNESLLERGEQRWYRGEELTHIGMPMGGIGAGQFFLTGRGALDQWQIVNNFNGNAHVPGSFFGVWAKSGDGTVAAKRLEVSEDAALPTVDAIEFSGEYPLAWIRYRDETLPVQVSLESFSPFIPLNAKDSGLPAVVFRFTVKNSSAERVDAAVMASAPNLVGWDGYARLDDTRYMGYIGNKTLLETRGRATALRFESGRGAMANLDAANTLVTNVPDVAYAMQLCENLDVQLHPAIADAKDAAPTVLWIGGILPNDAKSGLAPALSHVEQGATLIMTGEEDSLIAALAGTAVRDGKPMVFDAKASSAWREALPVSWKKLELSQEAIGVDRASALFEGVAVDPIEAPGHWAGTNLQVKEGATVLVASDDGTPLVVEGRHGDGRIIVCLAPIHEAVAAFDRKRVIGNLVAHAGDTRYAAQTGWITEAPFWGTMSLAVLDSADTVSAMPQWDDPKTLWEDFAADGRFDAADSERASAPGHTWNGALSVALSLAPGEEKQVTFLLTWHFPNRMRDWRYGLGPPAPQYDHRLGNQYNHWFADAGEVIEYVAGDFDRLDRETRLFHDSFYDSTLPRWLLDAVTANISIIRSPIIMWLEDGTVAGFEGSDACCPMNCTHVYNYAMSTAFLLPELERKVREIDLLEQMHPEEHFIPHRTLLPLSLPRLGNVILGPLHHALDGELGTILKTYREWRMDGDVEWLTALWPNAKKVMQHVFDEHDPNGEGVIRGEQPNTYDIHTYGSNTFIGSLYLATLRATEVMAQRMGDENLARECVDRFERGRAGYDAICWDGEYYRHVYDAPNATPEMYEQENSWGPGCLADQLFGQWWSNILGLGHVLPGDHVTQALQAIHRYNWYKDLSDHEHNQRVFAEGAEMGLLNCTWPKGGRPNQPVKYCDEVWTGIEYHVAASLIHEGMIAEGLQIARAVRDRYTGAQRNPWSEIECGGHYARAMASYSLLLAASAFDADAGAGKIAFAPRLHADDFTSFFSTGHGWGSLHQHRDAAGQRNRIAVRYGDVVVRELEIELERGHDPSVDIKVVGPAGASIAERHLQDRKCRLVFAGPVTLRAGDALEVEIA